MNFNAVYNCPQVPPTSPVVQRDEQHYVCCENSVYVCSLSVSNWSCIEAQQFCYSSI